MTWETAYSTINLLVLPAWAMLVFAPKASLTRKLVHSALWPLVMGGIYICFLGAALFFGQSSPDMGFSNLAGIMALSDHPNGALTGWTHYLAFDLFVGAWIGRDSQRRGVPHLLAVPSIVMSWLFGPVGLVLYLLTRLATGKGLGLEEA